MPVLGLVGGIGAGKSTIAAALAERGAMVLDADAIGHALLDQAPSREAVAERFGRDLILDGDPPSVDRPALGMIVFRDPAALRDLERILHPRMRRTFEKAIARVQRRRSAPLVVLDAAVLFEAGWNDLCDAVALVEATPEARLARVTASRGWSAELLATRDAAQLPLEQKRERSDLAIPNHGDRAATAESIQSLWARLRLPNSPRSARPGRKPGPPDS